MNWKTTKPDELKRGYFALFKEIQAFLNWKSLKHGSIELIDDLSPPRYNCPIVRCIAQTNFVQVVEFKDPLKETIFFAQ